MRDLVRLRERFTRDLPAVRMGNLASDLLRLGEWVRMRRADAAIVDLMREIAWMMEWSGECATVDLAEMQREICRWRCVWPVESARSILALRAQHMSTRVLELSGLLGSPVARKHGAEGRGRQGWSVGDEVPDGRSMESCIPPTPL